MHIQSNSDSESLPMKTFKGSSSFNNSQAFKRSTVVINGEHQNGSNERTYTKKGDWVRLVLKSRELNDSKSNRPSTIMSPTKFNARALLYGIAIFVAICYLLGEAFFQGSISILLKETAGVASGALTAGAVWKDDWPDKILSSEEALEYKVQFVPWKLKERFMKQAVILDELQKQNRSPFRKPQLALVCPNFESTPDSLYLITLWKGIQVLGYNLEVFSMHDGPMLSSWKQSGAAVRILEPDLTYNGVGIDWSKYETVILSSLDTETTLSSLLQDPFKDVPVIWIIHDENQVSDKPLLIKDQLLKRKKLFDRATVVVFPDYVLAMQYSLCDSGNFYVLPGHPLYVWKAEKFMDMYKRDDVREALNLQSHDIAVAVVGSPFSYKGVWREHAIVMQAIQHLSWDLQKNGFGLKLFFISAGSFNDYNVALQVLASQFDLRNDSVCHIAGKYKEEQVLLAADVVLYSSLREEQSFPNALLKAMVFERPIIAPNISVVQNQMQDGVHGLIFKPGNLTALSQALQKFISQSGVTNLGHEIGSCCKELARSMHVPDIIFGFAELLRSVIQLPSEVYLPLPASNVPEAIIRSWQWHLLETLEESIVQSHVPSRISEVEKQGVGAKARLLVDTTTQTNDKLSVDDWDEIKILQLIDETERYEEEQLSERNEQLRGTWEEVYRTARRIENARNDLHERDDGELERTGQPICIYEPYFGAGTWPLIGQKSTLYRGISMIPRQRRAGLDDIDASLRLPLLNHTYYQDVLCEFGAFLAMGNRIDRIHKNGWIGFQSWQAAGRKVSLSNKAEAVLSDAVRKGSDGDTLYFWVSTDSVNFDGSQSFNHRDFWSYCDAMNNGNCREGFLRTFRRMYGLPSIWNELPPMPADGDRWSSLHSWALPTSSFMEFIMFSRMFVSALDSEFYSDHHNHGRCYFGTSTTEVRHCHCRILDLLVNVWAYHSGRRMVFLDPVNGLKQEQHNLLKRRNHMWIRFFSYSTLKAMDEDLAEEVDDGILEKRWLWPQTGEVFCQRIQDRERRQRYAMKLEKKKRDKERVRRIRSRQRQKPLARE